MIFLLWIMICQLFIFCFKVYSSSMTKGVLNFSRHFFPTLNHFVLISNRSNRSKSQNCLILSKKIVEQKINSKTNFSVRITKIITLLIGNAIKALWEIQILGSKPLKNSFWVPRIKILDVLYFVRPQAKSGPQLHLMFAHLVFLAVI